MTQYKFSSFKQFLLLLVLSFIFFNVSFSQGTATKSEIIEKWKGADYYMHFVQDGETVQTIARLYNVTNVSILKANPEIASGLQPGRIIRVPVKSDNITDIFDQSDEIGTQKPDTAQYQAIHEVLPKETWYGIARQYKVPVTSLIDANPAIDTLKIGSRIYIPKTDEDYKVITDGFAEHTVLPHETLYGLSKKYNTTGQELIRLNPSLTNGLKAGQVIMVPGSSENNGFKIQVTDTTYTIHEVQRKETLYSISKQYGVDINDIVKSNPNYNGKLQKGDRLRIPVIVRHAKDFIKPDTIIKGRNIDQEATRDYSLVPCEYQKDNGKEFNIALMVPLQLEKVDSISVSDPAGLRNAAEYTAFDFIQFYEGAVIAADSMAKAGMNVRLHVFDVDYGNGVSKTRKVLYKPEMKSMDLIIGPFFAESFNLVAEFSKENKIPVINPLSRRAEVIKNNEFIFKMQPSAWVQYVAVANYIKSGHSNNNIVIVRRNQDENSNMAQIIKKALENDVANPIHVKEVIYSSKGWNGVNNSLNSSKPNLILILTSDRAVLPALLRDLASKKESQDITILGLSEWEDMELDYNYLIKLNTHFFNPWFVDYNNSAAKHFVRNFRNKYIAEPEIDKYAFLGYDATLYFLSALNNFGDRFFNCIEQYREPGLSNDMIFRKSPEGGYENCGTTVYKYADFSRVKLN